MVSLHSSFPITAGLDILIFSAASVMQSGHFVPEHLPQGLLISLPDWEAIKRPDRARPDNTINVRCASSNKLCQNLNDYGESGLDLPTPVTIRTLITYE